MPAILAAGIGQGVVLCEQDSNGWRPVRRVLENRAVTSVIARQGRLLAGTRQGIYRSDDVGQSWVQVNDGISIPLVRWLAFHPDVPGFVYAGTEPAGIFISHNGGDSWRICPEVGTMRDRFGWFLPYSPLAGCVRGFAIHGDRIYAAVEVGGVLITDDSGETWKLAPGSSGTPGDEGGSQTGRIHADVHSITVHPGSKDLISAPTGGGFYRSSNGGKTWQFLYDCYCRAVWVDPMDVNHLILGPADGVDREGRIEESSDGGYTWISASTGLQVPWPEHMVERFFQVDDHLLAILSNGELLSTDLNRIEWIQILREVLGITSVAVIL